MYAIKTKLILGAVACLIGITSCKRNEIQPYNGDRYLQFVDKYTDTIPVSFFLYPNKNEFQIKLPVKMVGIKTTENLSFSINVDAKATTAFPSLFNLDLKGTFKKGQARDTIIVNVFRQADLKGKETFLVLDLVANDNFKLGEVINRRRVLRITDKISKPVWWDATMTSTYLGTYSDKKFRTFVEVTGEGDLEIFSTEKRRDLMLEFKYYLIRMKDLGTPILEENGSDMLGSVPLIG
ncbi:DUF4843 domain-containing protein [Pedobacter hiemivivus]|uniref:DUF4843 domain-containing protein n=1 Tax=Pedobacter hiemivivus TaxID=2530454 RepID=A0A4R0N4D6_9SPHI|nr:DUF4843 domain-containing protein [Pedobacter hiemivivus]TCC94685.1 DUF4843 domain-containing protein [Pedobacter hiemivivus]TKC62412.1 DUF4843 domain-containing protein [Pedobacter hiemivivus]